MTVTSSQANHPTQTDRVGVPPTNPEAHQRATGWDFNNLLTKALTEQGLISKAYSLIHRFSLSNQMLATIQLQERGMAISPIASFGRWQNLGRQVKKGAKALALFMPISIHQQLKNEETGEEQPTGKAFTRFALKHHWFSLEQTEGGDYQEPLATPAWDTSLSLKRLSISEEPFQMLNGNIQGYALERSIAVNPVAALPHKTRFHELAHVVLGHTARTGCSDTSKLSRQIEEVEAEGVAFLLCSLLNLPGLAEARGYIQSWLGTQDLPERSAQRIFNAAQVILAAGKPL